MTVTGFWFAIEDATIDNGCLWAQPGGHRGPLRRVYQRVDAGSGSMTGRRGSSSSTTRRCPTPPDELRADRRARGHDGRAPRPAAALERRQPLPVSRHAYSVHCVSASATYPASNWLQRPPELPFRRVDEVSRALR